MNKKAAELTLNVIIVAVLVLIVLAVLIFIFSGKMTFFNKGLKDCASLGGTCLPDTVQSWSDEGKAQQIICKKGTPVYGTNCEEIQQGCCITLE